MVCEPSDHVSITVNKVLLKHTVTSILLHISYGSFYYNNRATTETLWSPTLKYLLSDLLLEMSVNLIYS